MDQIAPEFEILCSLAKILCILRKVRMQPPLAQFACERYS